MSKISSSPQRGTFQQEPYKKILIEETDQEKIASAQAMINIYQQWTDDAAAQELDEDWRKDNLEYELRSNDMMLEKVRTSDRYAQNLYAAMCNMQFQKIAVMPILKEQRWSCSWRHAGGIIADMRQSGDYINWYCSGIGSGLGNGDEDGTKGYVSEGIVTEEIETDLKQLGWIPVEWDDDK